jgi:hypothetical protein
MLAALFGDVLLRDRQFAFQDAGHYYYPLLRRVQQEWDAGRVPLWAPEASAGTPLLGNPTAAVLYPGKLVFFALPFPWAFRLYAVGHVALAAVAMWTLLRAWAVSPVGSLLGAIAYSFGVPVLSQTSNVIFLVGAAWLPLGVLAADLWVREGRRGALPALALVLALQTLGGDPEAAYLTLASAGALAAARAVGRAGWSRRRIAATVALLAATVLPALLALSWAEGRARRAANLGESAGWAPPRGPLVLGAWAIFGLILLRRARSPGAARELATRGGGLLVAAALGLALAGAQVVPVAESARMSFRAAESGGFHDAYAYSANPLQLLDALWPGAFGRLEGGYRSWLNALPPKPGNRLWMPSLYLGGMTLALAACGLARGGPPWRAGLVGVGAFSVLAALGSFASPLLWARVLAGGEGPPGPIDPAFAWQLRQDGLLRDGDGSPYWLLASALPGFRAFRYPPKLFVLAALAVAALAGSGWDRVARGEGRRAWRFAAIALGASALMLSLSYLGESAVFAAFGRLADRLRDGDEPLDVVRAVADLRRALAHGAAASGAMLAVLALARRRPKLAGVVAIVAMMLDLAVANAGRVVTVPQSAFEEEPKALAIIREAERANPTPGPFRIQRVGAWWPGSWADPSGGPRDFDTITRWERRSLRPLYHWPLGVEGTFYFDTIEPLDYGLFFLPWTLDPDPAVARKYAIPAGSRVWYHPRRGLDLWNTRYFIVPARLVWDDPARGYASMIPSSTFLYPPPGAFDGPDGPARRTRWGATDDFRVLRNDAAFPRAWVVHRARTLPPIAGLRVADRAKVMQELLYQSDEFWRLPGVGVRDPRSLAWVETSSPREVERSLSGAAPDPGETVTVATAGPLRTELTAVLKSPGLVVLADRFDPGWRVTIDGRPGEILRTNRAMRGVALPAGTHRLVFTYEPASFRLGLMLSGVGLFGMAAMAGWAFRGPRPAPPPG